MMFAFVTLFALFALSPNAVEGMIDVKGWIDKAGINKGDTIPEMRQKFLKRALFETQEYLAVHPGAKPSTYPYFNFIPQLRASVIPDSGTPVTWSASCFSQNTGIATTLPDGSIKLTITASGTPSTEGCYDNYWAFTLTGLEIFHVELAGDKSISWTLPADISDSEKWDLATKGIRIHEQTTDEATSAANLLKTLEIFVPELTKGVDPISARNNVQFMNDYPQFHMRRRDANKTSPPAPEDVHSGDFFGVIRLDGLDPMLAWGMGSSTGHTTVALWMDGELYICESTVTDSYWPTNGIQRTLYATWMQQAKDAGYNVVWAPLSLESRSKFNVTAAIDFFYENEGLDYGYNTLLWGWIDTIKNNYPCIPTDYSSVCLQWELVETLFAIIDRHLPSLSDKIWNQAWNHRIGTTGLDTADIYKTAFDQGITNSAVIPTIPEQDSWLYQTTRNGEPAVGRSMVCCVYVCSTWKAGGLFGDFADDVNCGELTNVDVYSLTVLARTNQQIMGDYTLELNRYNTKTPYAHMAETCESLPPQYNQDPKC